MLSKISITQSLRYYNVVTVASGSFRRAETVKAAAARGRGRRARASHGKATGMLLKLWTRAEPKRRGRGV